MRPAREVRGRAFAKASTSHCHLNGHLAATVRGAPHDSISRWLSCFSSGSVTSWSAASGLLVGCEKSERGWTSSGSSFPGT